MLEPEADIEPPPPTLTTLPCDVVDILLGTLLDSANVEDSDGAGRGGACAVAALASSCAFFRQLMQREQNVDELTRRRDELVSGIEPFGLLRSELDPPREPVAQPLLGLTPRSTLEQLAVCEVLCSWGTNQISLLVSNERDPLVGDIREDHVAELAKLLRRHRTATAVIESHAGSSAVDAPAASRQEAHRIRIALAGLGVDPKRCKCFAWGSQVASLICGRKGVGSEVFVQLGGAAPGGDAIARGGGARAGGAGLSRGAESRTRVEAALAAHDARVELPPRYVGMHCYENRPDPLPMPPEVDAQLSRVARSARSSTGGGSAKSAAARVLSVVPSPRTGVPRAVSMRMGPAAGMSAAERSSAAISQARATSSLSGGGTRSSSGRGTTTAASRARAAQSTRLPRPRAPFESSLL